jgi:OOP family OmpA-OmpF porin
MRHPIIAITVVSLLFGVDSATADDASWYLGVGIGDVAANYKVADFDDGSISEGMVDNSDSAWKVFGGYEINGHFAIELGVADLHNDADNRTTFSGISNGTGSRYLSLPGGEVSVDVDDISGYFIAAIGSLPITSRLGVSAKVGAVLWDAQQTIVDLDQRAHTLESTDALFGNGVEYRFDNGIGIRGEAERYLNMGGTDQDVTALSISYHF